MELEGKRIIVTGGAMGIGAAVTTAYADAGATLVAMDIADAEGEKVIADTGAGNRCFYQHCDVSNHDEVVAAFDEAVARMGGLDVHAHIAGIERKIPAEDISEEDWNMLFSINVNGTVYTNQQAFRHMKADGGHIINFGSGAGIQGMAGCAHYAASKGAVMSWTRTIAREWSPYNVTANAIAPVMMTPMAQHYHDRLNPEELAEFKAGLKERIPLRGEFGDPARDLAPFMIFLAGDGANFMTGQTFAVDGGMHMMSA